MAGWRSRGTGQTRWGQLALSAVAVAFLIAAIWLGGKLTYRYGIRVPRQPDHGEKLRLDRLAGIGRRIRAGWSPCLAGNRANQAALCGHTYLTSTWAAGSRGCP
jgi:hypothetical protein